MDGENVARNILTILAERHGYPTPPVDKSKPGYGLPVKPPKVNNQLRDALILILQKNPDPLVNDLLSNVPVLHNAIKDGNLSFHVDKKGFNSDRDGVRFQFHKRF